MGSGFIQLEEFSLRSLVQILPSGCSICVLTEMHDLLNSSTLRIVFNNNQIFLGFGETCNVTDSTHLSQAFEKSTHQQPTHYAQHAEDCQNEQSAIVLWLRASDIEVWVDWNASIPCNTKVKAAAF